MFVVLHVVDYSERVHNQRSELCTELEQLGYALNLPTFPNDYKNHLITTFEDGLINWDRLYKVSSQLSLHVGLQAHKIA